MWTTRGDRGEFNVFVLGRSKASLGHSDCCHEDLLVQTHSQSCGSCGTGGGYARHVGKLLLPLGGTLVLDL